MSIQNRIYLNNINGIRNEDAIPVSEGPGPLLPVEAILEHDEDDHPHGIIDAILQGNQALAKTIFQIILGLYYDKDGQRLPPPSPGERERHPTQPGQRHPGPPTQEQ